MASEDNACYSALMIWLEICLQFWLSLLTRSGYKHVYTLTCNYFPHKTHVKMHHFEASFLKQFQGASLQTPPP